MPDLRPVPAGASERDASVAAVLLHGRWQTPQYMIEVAGRIGAPDVAYFALPAQGGTWYPSTFLAPYEENRAALEVSLDQVDAEIRELEGRGWTRDRIALIGFSQGACLACEYVHRNPDRWGALIVFTGGLVGPEGHAWAKPASLKGTPVLMSNGDTDPFVPWNRTVETGDVFRSAGAEVTMQLYPGREHLVNEEEVATARAMLADAVQRARV